MSEMGFNVLLRSNNSYRLMSALGQKQTLGKVRPMSAVPRKRTSLKVIGMSALCHFRTFATLIRKSKLSLNDARQSMYNSLDSCQRDVPKSPHRSGSDDARGGRA